MPCIDRATLSDAEFKALSAHYDDAKILEIIQLCGFYRTVSYLANALRLPLEETAARFPMISSCRPTPSAVNRRRLPRNRLDFQRIVIQWRCG